MSRVGEDIQNVDDIKHILYINLEHRVDRRAHCEEQFKLLNLTPERLNAIRFSNGAIGAATSHLTALEHAKRQGWPHVLICEDDLLITDVLLLKENFKKIIDSGIKWDVVLFGGDNKKPYKKVKSFAIRVNKCISGTAYLLKDYYYQTVIDNIREGLINLIQYPELNYRYAFDCFWHQLQKRDNWYLLYPEVVTQMPGYSDIMQKDMDYSNLLNNHLK